MRLAAPGIDLNTGLMDPNFATYNSIETINPMMGQGAAIETINPMMGMMGQQTNLGGRPASPYGSGGGRPMAPMMGQNTSIETINPMMSAQGETASTGGTEDDGSGDFLSGLFGLLGLGAGVGAGGAAVASGIDRLQTIGQQAVIGTQVTDPVTGQLVTIPGANQLAQQAVDMSQFQPFTVTTATGGQFGATPTIDPETGQIVGQGVTMGLSDQEQFIQNMLMGQAEQGLFQGPYGEAQRQQAAQQAFGLGGQFMGAAGTQPADLNLLRGQFAGQVGGMLGQQPNPAIGQFGQQALGMGAAGLGQQAPSDVEALRRQYAGLAGQAAGDVLTPTANREADVFERIRATQRPEEERQRLQLEERLAQQGRLGVRTAMFGGTPEQLAMAKAQEESQNSASLMAMQQAQSERQQALGTAQTLGGMFGQQAGMSSQLQSAAQQRSAQLSQLGLSAQQIESQLQSEGLGRAATAAGQAGQMAQLAGGLQAQQAGLGAQFAGLGSQLSMQDMAAQQAQQQLSLGALTGAYMPQNQLLAAQQASQLFPQLQQRGQLFGAGQFGETSMAGLEAMLVAEQAAANLLGGIGSNVLSGLFSPMATGDGGIGSLFGNVLGGLFGDD